MHIYPYNICICIIIYIKQFTWLGFINCPHFIVFKGSTQQLIEYLSLCLCLYACIFKQVMEQSHVILDDIGFCIWTQHYSQIY